MPGWLLLLLLLVAPASARAQSPEPPCGCPLGGGNWLLFKDSNTRPNVPDFWDSEFLEIDEVSACRHGVSFVFTTQQDESLFITALFFPEPTPELLESRLHLRPGIRPYDEEYRRIRERYDTLRGEVERVFGPHFDEYGRLVFRWWVDLPRPRILDPRHRLTLEWQSARFDLRGYLDVYFTQMM
ncbi:MAG: hypothetical protein R3E12_11045 [Candidatus Eisenbacteria bacterium]